MKKFGLYSICPKCGVTFDEISPTFAEYKTGIFDMERQENIAVPAFDGEFDEYLLRKCRFCGYKWQEGCVGTEKENEDESCHKEYQKGFEDGRIERKSNNSAHAFNRGYLKGLEKSKDDVEKAVIEKEYQKGFKDGRVYEHKEGKSEKEKPDTVRRANIFKEGYLKGLEKSKDDVEKAVIEKDNIYNEGFEDGRVYGYKKGKGESKFNPTEWISTVSKGYYDKGFNKGMLEGHAKGFKKGINYGKI